MKPLRQRNNVIDMTKRLPKEVDTINFWALSWCEEILDHSPTQDEIDQAEAYITELLMHFGEKFQARQMNTTN